MKKVIVLAVFLFINSLLKAQLPNTLSAEEKIYGLSKFWQEANYNFVYMDQVDRGVWDSTYKALIKSVPKTENDYQYYRALQKFCSLLHDGHTLVSMPGTITPMRTMFGDYRLFIANIEDKAIIVATNLSKKKEVPTGSEIIEVNGLPTEKYIEKFVIPYISVSSAHILKDKSIIDLLLGVEGDTYALKIRKPDGNVVSLNLTHKTTTEEQVYPDFGPMHPILEFEWKNKNIAYLALNSFSDQKIDSLFKGKLADLYQAKALIIDLRLNGGGSGQVAFDIFQYLTKDPVLYGSKSRSRISIATYKAWGTFTKAKDTINNAKAKERLLTYEGKTFHDFDYAGDAVKITDKRISIPTVILIGHNTASAAEDFLIYADKQKSMYKIGDNTNGSTGQPLIFPLPGGGEAWICTKQDTYPDGRTFVGTGIKPDLKVKQTVTEYLNKKDPAMDAALLYLKDKIK